MNSVWWEFRFHKEELLEMKWKRLTQIFEKLRFGTLCFRR